MRYQIINKFCQKLYYDHNPNSYPNIFWWSLNYILFNTLLLFCLGISSRQCKKFYVSRPRRHKRCFER